MKIEVIAYHAAGVTSLSMRDHIAAAPKPLKFKVVVSEDEAYTFEVKEIIKTDLRAAGKTKFYEYDVKYQDEDFEKRAKLRFYIDNLAWEIIN